MLELNTKVTKGFDIDKFSTQDSSWNERQMKNLMQQKKKLLETTKKKKSYKERDRSQLHHVKPRGTEAAYYYYYTGSAAIGKKRSQEAIISRPYLFQQEVALHEGSAFFQ